MKSYFSHDPDKRKIEVEAIGKHNSIDMETIFIELKDHELKTIIIHLMLRIKELEKIVLK